MNYSKDLVTSAVTPRPPGTNKVREFIDSLSHKPVPVPNN